MYTLGLILALATAQPTTPPPNLFVRPPAAVEARKPLPVETIKPLPVVKNFKFKSNRHWPPDNAHFQQRPHPTVVHTPNMVETLQTTLP